MPGRPCAPFPVLTGPPCWRKWLWRPVHRFPQGWKGCIRAGSRKQSPVSDGALAGTLCGRLGRKPCSAVGIQMGTPEVRSALRPPTTTPPARFRRPRQTLPAWSPPAKPGAPHATGFALAADHAAAETWPPKSVAEFAGLRFWSAGAAMCSPSGPAGRRTGSPGLRRAAGRLLAGGPALQQELCAEETPSLWAVAGRLPATRGRQWVKW